MLSYTLGKHAIIPCCCEDWTCPLWYRKGIEIFLLVYCLLFGNFKKLLTCFKQLEYQHHAVASGSQ